MAIPAKLTQYAGALLESTERTEGRTAVKTGISAFLGWSLGLGISFLLEQSDTIAHGLWCALAAIVVQQAHLGSTYRSAWSRFLGVLIGCAMGAIFTQIIDSSPITLGFSVFTTVAICSFFHLKESIRIACMSVAVVMILYSSHPNTSPWLFAFYRFLDSVLGITAAVAVAHVFWPLKARKRIEDNIGKGMDALTVLYRLAAKTEPMSEEEERLWQTSENALLRSISLNKGFLDESRLELLAEYATIEEWSRLSIHIDLLYAATKALNGINKEQLSKILDEGLVVQAIHTAQLNELAIYRMGKNLKEHRMFRPLVELNESLEKLNQELTRFRSNKTTRQYGLEVVESFFVYFSHLRSSGTNLIEMQDFVKKIIEGE